MTSIRTVALDSVGRSLRRLLAESGAPPQVFAGEALGAPNSPGDVHRLVEIPRNHGFVPRSLLTMGVRRVRTVAVGSEAVERYLDSVSSHGSGASSHYHWPSEVLSFEHLEGSSCLFDSDLDTQALVLWGWGQSAESTLDEIITTFTEEPSA